MVCEDCGKNEANVKYTHIVNGAKIEMNLCEECSKKLGIGNVGFNIPINFNNFFGEFLNEYNESFLQSYEKPAVLKCNGCKMTYDEFAKTGKFGCSNCYKTFSKKIDPVLRKLHVSDTYVGRKGIANSKVKGKAATSDVKQTQKAKPTKAEKLSLLKEALKEAIREEKYEDAAKLRDEIKKMEG